MIAWFPSYLPASRAAGRGLALRVRRRMCQPRPKPACQPPHRTALPLLLGPPPLRNHRCARAPRPAPGGGTSHRGRGRFPQPPRRAG
eukprot:scaffold113391_cov54-Phaeocystis_antarctica.AAC.1